MKVLHSGFSNIISTEKIVAIISPDTAVAKRLRDEARDENDLIDCTMGRKLRSMVLTESNYVFLSSIRPEALMDRLSIKESSPSDE